MPRRSTSKHCSRPGGWQRVEIWIEPSQVYRHKGHASAAIRAFDSACQAVTAALESMSIDRSYIFGPLRVHNDEALRRGPDDPLLKEVVEKLSAMPAK